MAHELYFKYFQYMDSKRIEFILIEMQKDPLFDHLETLSFAYKSLFMVFSSVYLAKEFCDLPKVINHMTFDEFEKTYYRLYLVLAR